MKLLQFTTEIRSILIIEDCKVTQSVIKKKLTLLPCVAKDVHIDFADNITDAAELLRQGTHDLITLDGELNSRSTIELYPLLVSADLIGRTIMITSKPDLWKDICATVGLNVIDKTTFNVSAAFATVAA